MAGYGFQIDLNTSFTGEDSLDISIDAGNAAGAGYAEFDGNSYTLDYLQVDGVAYTFPVGDATVMVGDNKTLVHFSQQLVFTVDHLTH